jgi:cytidyltransferase-like protein
LDTRSKIVDALPKEARLSKIVLGYFDPMHAGHIRRLRELSGPGERLTVVIADPPEPILPARARAELVAGLECVAYVVTGEAAAEGFPDVVDERPTEALRSREFAQYVLARHNAR